METADKNTEPDRPETVPDLELSAEQAEEAKAGTGTFGTTKGAGKVSFQDLP